MNEEKLLQAIQDGNLEAAEALVYQVSDLNWTNEKGQTALIMAAFKGYTSIVKLLVEPYLTAYDTIPELIKRSSFSEVLKVPRLDIQDNSGRTALIYAAFMGHIDIVEKLLEGDIGVDIQDVFGCTALMYAARLGYTKIVDKLISERLDIDLIDLDIQNHKGYTALTYAAMKNHTDIVKKLIGSGARLDNKDGILLGYLENMETYDIIGFITDRLRKKIEEGYRDPEIQEGDRRFLQAINQLTKVKLKKLSEISEVIISMTHILNLKDCPFEMKNKLQTSKNVLAKQLKLNDLMVFASVKGLLEQFDAVTTAQNIKPYVLENNILETRLVSYLDFQDIGRLKQTCKTPNPFLYMTKLRELDCLESQYKYACVSQMELTQSGEPLRGLIAAAQQDHNDYMDVG